MNPTIEKFGYPATLLRELDHWVILLRPEQVTLGSLVLAAKSDVRAYSALPAMAFGDQGEAVRLIEDRLAAFIGFERINYLMLMMVDPNVHFHVIPRYQGSRTWEGKAFVDAGWPGPPQLGSSIALDAAEIARMTAQLSIIFR